MRKIPITASDIEAQSYNKYYYLIIRAAILYDVLGC